MKKSLVGYTGFVGTNIADSCHFDGLYNSQNIESAYGTKPDLLVYSGVPAEMFLANNNPSADLAVIEQAAENICKISPKRLVLISTIAVLDDVDRVDEDHIVDTEKLSDYGLHRYKLEQMAQEIIPSCHILRLPALFGKSIKKNFIYDMLHFFPAMLNQAKYETFLATEAIIADCYKLQDNGFYKLQLTEEKKDELRAAFKRLDFSALNFTDSRSIFQFYNLAHIWEHIELVIAKQIPLLHLAVEPLSAGEVYRELCGRPFVNEVGQKPFNYNYRTKHDTCFGGENGYIYNREQVLSDLKPFVEEAK